MGEARPWQIGVVVVGLLVLVGSVVWQCASGRKVDFADTILLVDVTTGQLYRSQYRTDASVMFPARSPATNDYTLFGVIHREGETEYRLPSEALEYMRANKLESKVVDMRTGVVTVQPGDPKSHDLYRRQN